jgi:hypothetical protein
VSEGHELIAVGVEQSNPCRNFVPGFTVDYPADNWLPIRRKILRTGRAGQPPAHPGGCGVAKKPPPI